MIKKIFRLLMIDLLIAPLLLIYKRLTRKAYYVSGTFINERGVRMWFKTVFTTNGNKMPLKSLEDSMSKHFQANAVVIVFFNRIPYGMVKYVDKEMDININIKS
jgi:hypothetical protein